MRYLIKQTGLPISPNGEIEFLPHCVFLQIFTKSVKQGGARAKRAPPIIECGAQFCFVSRCEVWQCLGDFVSLPLSVSATFAGH